MENLLLEAFVYLVAAVVAVPLANRLGLGSVLGYLIAGIVIGPILGVVGAEARDLQHFAEFGVVMMLFLVGLELEPKSLWAMRHRLVGLGGLQVSVTALAFMGAGYAIGLPWQVSLAIGLVFSLSSTAIVLQTLGEKGLTRSEGGEASFSVLLFQDIAVIPILALMPLLAVSPDSIQFVGQSFATVGESGAMVVDAAQHGADAGGRGSNLIGRLPAWAQTLSVLAAVGVVVLGGHYLTRPVFRFIAEARMREIFTAAALLLIVGIAVLMSSVGLSPALGTFLAGVVLANSEYRHELESDIEPFKGLLLGLFFITVGAGIDFLVLFDHFLSIMAIVVCLIVIKGLALYGLAALFRIRGSAAWLLTLGMAQAGEFGFVLLSFSVQSNVIPADLSQQLSLVVAISMLLTPALFILYQRLIASRIETEEPVYDDIDLEGTVIIAGLGRFGQIVNRILLSQGHKTVVLDHHHGTISGLRKFGVRAFFGDPSRPDLLIAAGIRDAKALVVAIDEPDKATMIVEHVTRDFPHVKIIARAQDRTHVYELYAAGAREIVRETFDSAVRAGKYTLQTLGHHPFDIEKAARVFVKEDRRLLAELAQVWEPGVNVYDNEAYMARAREQAALLEKAMQGLDRESHDRTERGWTPPPKGGKVREET
ncbi:MAG: cation:proton antiporter [Paracoccaceae bacterium]